MEQMYKGMPFSPTATLTANISVTDAIIPVSDVDAFPDAPNIATIGSIAGPNETIIYTGKTTTSLTGCTRGVEGTASDWAVDELIGRNFTAKDHADMVKNIEELENNKLDASYKVDVVNTADVSVAGKALDAKQNNPNITGTLAQKVANNTQQINVLSGTQFLTGGSAVLKNRKNGKFACQNAPDAPTQGTDAWYIYDFSFHPNEEYGRVIATGYVNGEKMMYHNILNGAWQGWKLLENGYVTLFTGMISASTTLTLAKPCNSFNKLVFICLRENSYYFTSELIGANYPAPIANNTYKIPALVGSGGTGGFIGIAPNDLTLGITLEPNCGFNIVKIVGVRGDV